MVFYEMDEASLMQIEVNPIETLASSVTYSSHFDIACPQHDPKRSLQAQCFTRNNKSQCICHGVEIIPFILYICDDSNIEPILCKHIIDL
jgi:hypothetical protein